MLFLALLTFSSDGPSPSRALGNRKCAIISACGLCVDVKCQSTARDSRTGSRAGYLLPNREGADPEGLRASAPKKGASLSFDFFL